LGGEQGTIFPVLKVPRQCPLVLLVEEMNMIGINFYDVDRVCIIVNLGRKFDVNNGRAASETCSATWNLGTNSEFAV
jgi:hypothetical protein